MFCCWIPGRDLGTARGWLGLAVLSKASKVRTGGQQSLPWGGGATVHVAGDEAIALPKDRVARGPRAGAEGLWE